MITIQDLTNHQLNEMSLQEMDHINGGTIDPWDALYLTIVEGVRVLA
ncbi:MAG: hypothetical protein RI580_13095 [Halothece sp. Uz-M2-17]|nr:hypothetical protein [Halothece sp. Uz-M2-17]